MRRLRRSRWAQIGATSAQIVGGAALGLATIGVIAIAATSSTPTTTTTTTVPVSQTLNCYQTPTTPHLCGFPDSTTTGIQAGHTLTQVPASGASAGAGWTSNNGDVTVCGQSCSGAKSSTISDLEVPLNHDVGVSASNVTISNLKVDGQTGRTTAQDFEGVVVSATAHGVTLDHCDIAGDSASPQSGPAQTSNPSAWVNRGDAAVQIALPGGYGITVSNCNIHGFHGPFWNRQETGATSQTLSQVRITGNYVHAVECWAYQNGFNTTCQIDIPLHGSVNTDHCNLYGQSNAAGLVAGGPQNVLIDNNTWAMDYQPCATAIVSADSDNAQTNNLNYVVYHNLMVYSPQGDICLAPGRSGGSPKVAGAPSYYAFTYNHLSNCDRPIYDGPPLNGNGTGQSPNNIECGNIWDSNSGAPGATGFSVDVYAFAVDAATNHPAVTTCGTPAWTIPNWTNANPATTTTTTTATTAPTTTTTTGSGGASVTITDPQCQVAQATCPMTFTDDVTKDRNPLSGAGFGDATPGLLAGSNPATFTSITTMTGTCVPANAAENCGFKTHYTTADNGKSFFFRNCNYNTPTNSTGILIDAASTVKLYFTNCRIQVNATAATSSVAGSGTIGAGGSLHFIHSLIQHGPSLPNSGCAAAETNCHAYGLIFDGSTATDNEVVYSEFDGLGDNLRADEPVDIEWNYFHNTYCGPPNCVHSDGIESYYGASNSAPHPVTIAHNYFSGPNGWDSSAALNLTDDFGANSFVTFTANKILPAAGAGWVLVIPQRCSPINNCNPPADVTNITITNNMLFAEPGVSLPYDTGVTPPYKYPLLTRFPGSTFPTVCDGAATGGTAWPNSCITSLSGNTWIDPAGASNPWPF